MRSTLFWDMAPWQWVTLFVVCSTLDEETNRLSRNTGHQSSSDGALMLLFAGSNRKHLFVKLSFQPRDSGFNFPIKPSVVQV
jgi:hypothetical protein